MKYLGILILGLALATAVFSMDSYTKGRMGWFAVLGGLAGIGISIGVCAIFFPC